MAKLYNKNISISIFVESDLNLTYFIPFSQGSWFFYDLIHEPLLPLKELFDIKRKITLNNEHHIKSSKRHVNVQFVLELSKLNLSLNSVDFFPSNHPHPFPIIRCEVFKKTLSSNVSLYNGILIWAYCRAFRVCVTCGIPLASWLVSNIAHF